VVCRHQLHHDCGGRQCQREPHDDGRGQVEIEHGRQDGQQDGTGGGLHDARAEHDAPQGPELFHRQFQPQQEQQEQHAQFRERRSRFGLGNGKHAERRPGIRKGAESPRTQRHASEDEADNSGQFQHAQRRHHEPGSDQEDQRVLDQDLVASFVHADSPFIASRRPRCRHNFILSDQPESPREDITLHQDSSKLLTDGVPNWLPVWKVYAMRFLSVALLCLFAWLAAPGLASAAQVYRDVVYNHMPAVSDGNFTMDIYAPDEAEDLPIIIMVHGGAWTYGNKQNAIGPKQSDFFTDEGFIYVSINYRLAPDHPFPAPVEDLASAIAFLYRNADTYGGDPESIFLMGHSSGAHSVALVSIDPQYLRAEGLGLGVIKGTVPLDGASYNLVENRREEWRAAAVLPTGLRRQGNRLA
jgi:hypothetical protein